MSARPLVAVVDDDISVRESLPDLLQQVGFAVQAFASAEAFLNSDAVPSRPERICQELTDWLPDDATLVCDTFHAAIWTAQMMRMFRPGQRYIRCAGSLGWSLPASIGVKCAVPERAVICSLRKHIPGTAIRIGGGFSGFFWLYSRMARI